MEHIQRSQMIAFPLCFQGWWDGSFIFLFLFFCSCSPLCFFVPSWQWTQQAFSVFRNASSPAGCWNYVLRMAAPLVLSLLPCSPRSCRWQTWPGVRQPWHLWGIITRGAEFGSFIFLCSWAGQWDPSSVAEDTWKWTGNSSASFWTLGFIWFL